MYISSINICNFRNFVNEEIKFNDSLNIIIGHNNAGKTNLLKALNLVIDINHTKRLEIADFNKEISLEELKENPPKVEIQVSIKKSENTSESYFDDLVTISSWLTKLEDDFEAKLTYVFFLPENDLQNYHTMISHVDTNLDENKQKQIIWNLIEHNFLRLYIHKIYGGDSSNKETADRESLSKIDVQFLDAIRDIERDLFTGKNTLLREVLEFFIDYDIKSDDKKDKDQIRAEIRTRKDDFENNMSGLIDILRTRLDAGKKEILEYTEQTGASFNGAMPDFDSSPSDFEMLSTLKLIVQYETGIKIPITHNGLGFNNLIYISLLLAKMQLNSSQEYFGSNSKIFSTLIIEEPEAHLHPSMQYKFLKFLKENHKSKKVRQIFITSHSSNITSAVDIEDIICISSNSGTTKASNFKEIFKDDVASKFYVQRFLDATKSEMLFAPKIILVEGIAEQLLLSVFAQYINLSLEDQHVSVINIGGRYFDHFLKIFNKNNDSAIDRKVACITDFDPARKKKNIPNARAKACYPYEYNFDDENYKYSFNEIDSENYNNSSNIKFFQPDSTFGKTLEYDLMANNPSQEILLTESMSNCDEIKDLITLYNDGKSLNEMINKLSTSDTNTNIKTSLQAIPSDHGIWKENELKKALIASRYLNSISKGEHALQLSIKLLENLDNRAGKDYVDLILPKYIKDALEWICQ
ncbi:ATP-dependent nuclease [Acinetobacter seifertii]|uniref:ATP-dependent nuclease n=1 Tax=Acinetobacter seifertii TaxID=1530123 RepID=UPI003EE2BD48